MNGKHLFLTSAGLTDKMKEKFFDIIGKCFIFQQLALKQMVQESRLQYVFMNSF